LKPLRGHRVLPEHCAVFIASLAESFAGLALNRPWKRWSLESMVKSFRLVLVLASLIGLCACATTAPPARPAKQAAALPTPDDHASVYGLYLAGQVAMIADDSRTAADFFSKAKEQTPGDAGFLKERVFSAALLSGDVPRAAAMAPGDGEGSPSSQALGLLAQAVEALAQGDGAKAYAKLATPAPGGVYIGASMLLKPWAAAAAGRWSDAIATPAVNDRLLRLIASLDQAQLFERDRRYEEAETAFKALLAQKSFQPIVGPAYGVFLERRGRRKEAVALYDQMIADNPKDVAALAARARAMSKGTPPSQLSIREGAAQALMIPAEAAIADKQNDMGLIYLRLILRLDPNRDDAWLAAGDVMAASGDVRSSRAAFEQIDPKAPSYVEARSRLAWSYQTEDKDTALKIARETATAKPDNDAAQLTLAYLLRADEHYDESIKVLDPLIAGTTGKSDWQLYYMRAVALERSGRWPDAQKDLNKALALKPNEPEVMNYLGYSWVNRGEHVKDGMALIQKAVDAQPDEGAYVDSLGWAYYRLADYKNAVETLEHAVALDAGDPEINDHLGDAYWRVGRQDEARFQWRAVLSMQPDPDVKARVETKLGSPLGVDAMVAAAPVAHP
jgi:tetratricopeptide (TPR) repeat protein